MWLECYWRSHQIICNLKKIIQSSLNLYHYRWLNVISYTKAHSWAFNIILSAFSQGNLSIKIIQYRFDLINTQTVFFFTKNKIYLQVIYTAGYRISISFDPISYNFIYKINLAVDMNLNWLLFNKKNNFKLKWLIFFVYPIPLLKKILSKM